MSKPITAFVDVDDTLVRTVGTSVIPMPAVIQRVRELREGSATIYCWSAGGADYARSIAERLKIADCFESFLSKPTLLLDDQTPLDWPGLRLVHPSECQNS